MVEQTSIRKMIPPLYHGYHPVYLGTNNQRLMNIPTTVPNRLGTRSHWPSVIATWLPFGLFTYHFWYPFSGCSPSHLWSPLTFLSLVIPSSPDCPITKLVSAVAGVACSQTSQNHWRTCYCAPSGECCGAGWRQLPLKGRWWSHKGPWILVMDDWCFGVPGFMTNISFQAARFLQTFWRMTPAKLRKKEHHTQSNHEP